LSETSAILSLGPAALVYLVVLTALAAFARGYTGFGAAALMITGGSVVVAPQALVPLIILIDTAIGSWQLRRVTIDVDRRRLVTLLIGTALGTPLGVLAIGSIAADTARILVALYVIVISIALLRGWRLGRPVGGMGMVLLGFACGFITGLIAMGGLIVAAFLTADDTKPQVMRATLIAYFLPLGLLAISLFAMRGAYDQDGLLAVMMALPMFAAGVWLGGRHFLSASPEQFHRFTLAFLIVLAAAAFLRAALG
jgi:hypothetical protein